MTDRVSAYDFLSQGLLRRKILLRRVLMSFTFVGGGCLLITGLVAALVWGPHWLNLVLGGGVVFGVGCSVDWEISLPDGALEAIADNESISAELKLEMAKRIKAKGSLSLRDLVLLEDSLESRNGAGVRKLASLLPADDQEPN